METIEFIRYLYINDLDLECDLECDLESDPDSDSSDYSGFDINVPDYDTQSTLSSIDTSEFDFDSSDEL